MEPLRRRESLLEVSARGLIYASVLLGVGLLVQLYSLVPDWLFVSVFAGWFLYLIVAVLIAQGRRFAYPAALILSLVTLAVSLPQPEHFALLGQGLTLGSLTFVAGSVLQVGVIVAVAGYLIQERRTTPKVESGSTITSG